MNSTPGLAARTAGAVSGAVRVPVLPDPSSAPDDELVAALREAAAARRQVEAIIVELTAELAARSERRRGQEGLSARLGSPTVEHAVQLLTGSTRAEAKAFSAVADGTSGTAPWLAPVGTAVAAERLGVSTAAAIASGLGSPDADVSADDLHDAARSLVRSAIADPLATPEGMGRAARQLREQLDAARVGDVERRRRDKRSLTWSRLPDGMTRMTALLDPESAAVVTTAIDSALSPRRGGPRFVDARSIERSAALDADPRSTAQLAVDTLVDIVQLATRAAGSDVDPAAIFGATSPAVRVHVPVDALTTGVGSAWIEGQDAALSPETAARHVCTSGILPVLLRGNVPIDSGRTHRLHSVRQRIALAARWGGCAWHECSRPPAMTEIHHVVAFEGSNTTLDNGIPLCRFHHLQLHNSGWRIQAIGSPPSRRYRLHPPPDHPAAATPRELSPRHVTRRHEPAAPN